MSGLSWSWTCGGRRGVRWRRTPGSPGRGPRGDITGVTCGPARSSSPLWPPDRSAGRPAARGHPPPSFRREGTSKRAVRRLVWRFYWNTPAGFMSPWEVTVCVVYIHTLKVLRTWREVVLSKATTFPLGLHPDISHWVYHGGLTERLKATLWYLFGAFIREIRLYLYLLIKGWE